LIIPSFHKIYKSPYFGKFKNVLPIFVQIRLFAECTFFASLYFDRDAFVQGRPVRALGDA